MKRLLLSMFQIGVAILAAMTLAACSPTSDPAQDAVNSLSNPSGMTLSGAGTGSDATNNYVFATAAGTIDASANEIVASFGDSNLPLQVSAGAYSNQINSGSCLSLGTMIASVSGASNNQVSSSLSATGCSDQATLNIFIDTSQVTDSQGYYGQDVYELAVVVDLAPEVVLRATGNTGVDGSGANATSGTFSMASDNSIVVTFSKDMTGGTFNATLSNCAAVLGTPTLVPGSGGTSLAWPLTGFSGFASGTTCQLNVSGVTDEAGNPDDGSDPRASMTVTFQ